MKNAFLDQVVQGAQKTQKNYKQNLKEALEQKENFVVMSTESGIGKMYTSKEVCEEMGLKYYIVHPVISEMMDKDLNDEISEAVEEGAQVVFITESERMHEGVGKVFDAFERQDVQVVVMYRNNTDEYSANSNTSHQLRDWTIEQELKVLEYRIK